MSSKQDTNPSTQSNSPSIPLMMSVSGVRGIVGESLTPAVLVDLASAFAKFLGNKGHIIIGRDSRNTGPHISQLISSTMALNGIGVTDIGLVPTPTVQLFVEKTKAKAGIVVTASHNPIQWNALKLIKQDGTFLSKQEADQVFSIFHEKNFSYASYKKIGQIQEDFSSFQMHIDAIMKQIQVDRIKASGFKVLIDSVGGAGSRISPLFLQELGCHVVEHNTEITGDFPRGSEPTVDNIRATGKKVKEQNCDIGFCQDPDADRLAIINELGQPIGEELTLALAIQQKLTKNKGPVVVNLSTSRINQDIAETSGVPFWRAPVGEINVVDMMKEKKAFIGGEGNGGVIDPVIHLGRDSLVGMAYILERMAETGKTISQLVADLPSYHIQKETFDLNNNISFDDIKKEIMQNLPGESTDNPVTIDERDGLWLGYEAQKSWVHIRSSNTEPILRLIAEGPSMAQCNQLIQSIRPYILKK